MRTRSEVEGELLHAKHALQPNTLGYCGPDENGTILEHLHQSSVSEELTSTLTRFEAAYPFVRMIAKSTGRQPFDREVTEAYWIGNHLLESVPLSDFFEFSHRDLAPKGRAGSKEETKSLFRELGPLAKPHHTFYVLGMYARSSPKSGSEAKLLELMDSCRISWGRVLEVKPKTLLVQRRSLTLKEGRLGLSPPGRKEVRYDPEIPSFSTVRKGDTVSVHWNFASDRLSPRQLANLTRYTSLDVEATNRLVATRGAL